VAEVLIVDDERVIREGLKAMLQAEGLVVRTAKDGADALKSIAEKRPDLVLLDIMMPKTNGFCCCESIRRIDVQLPIIFLTAKKSEVDQVRGLGLGADDFITKTTSEAILLARINRALVRGHQSDRTTSHDTSATIRLGSVSVDLRTLSVSENGREIAVLTRGESDVLKILHAHAGERLTPDDLIEELHGEDYAGEESSVYILVHRLRRKLRSAGRRIVNMRGIGYVLTQ